MAQDFLWRGNCGSFSRIAPAPIGRRRFPAPSRRASENPVVFECWNQGVRVRKGKLCGGHSTTLTTSSLDSTQTVSLPIIRVLDEDESTQYLSSEELHDDNFFFIPSHSCPPGASLGREDCQRRHSSRVDISTLRGGRHLRSSRSSSGAVSDAYVFPSPLAPLPSCILCTLPSFGGTCA